MAVDANVLINERIREELRHGRTPISAIEAGFTRAYGTIIDSQLTTFIAGLVMFWLGSGPIRGFAVTLTLGIMTTVYTAFTIARLLVVWWLGAQKKRARSRRRSPTSRRLLEDGQRPLMKFLFKGVDFFPHDTRWKIIERRYIFIGVSWALAMLAAVLLMTRGLNYGVDFKGGSLIEVQSKAGRHRHRRSAHKLDKLGIGDVQVQAVGTGNEALIRVAQQVPTRELTRRRSRRPPTTRSRARWARTSRCAASRWWGRPSPPSSSAPASSPSSPRMFGILLYVWFRFEWQFAVAAILALSHDVFITVGMFSLLWYEFDLSVVAAMLTLAGYSINDTVVVFDRIRENLRRYKRMPLIELLNLSINETLSRTVLTSVTTALAVLALYIFGTRGHPRLLVRHAVRHRHRHLLVDLRRRAASCCCSASSASGAARPPSRRPRRTPPARPRRENVASK